MDNPRRAAFVAGMHAGILALLDGLGGPELLVIGVVVLLLFGSKRMPEIGRGIGRAIREFKRATSSVEENIREVLYEEPRGPTLRPPAQRRPHRASSHGETHSPPEPASTPPTQPPPAAPLNEAAPAESPETAPRPEHTTQRLPHTPPPERG